MTTPTINLEEYKGLIKTIANKAYLKFKNSTILNFDDFEQIAYIAILDAVKRYKPDKGANVKTFVMLRVHGAIIDAVRSQEWISREDIKKFKEDQNTFLPRHLNGLDNNEYKSLRELKDRRPSSRVDLSLMEEDVYDYVFKDLFSRNKFIAKRYYIDNITANQIGKELSLHESRISQLLKTEIEPYVKKRLLDYSSND